MFGDIKILLNTYDPDVVEAQKAFISTLGPYRILATAEEKEAFWKRVENYWFVRWPLNKACHESTHGSPGALPAGFEVSKTHTRIRASSFPQVSRIRE